MLALMSSRWSNQFKSLRYIIYRLVSFFIMLSLLLLLPNSGTICPIDHISSVAARVREISQGRALYNAFMRI